MDPLNLVIRTTSCWRVPLSSFLQFAFSFIQFSVYVTFNLKSTILETSSAIYNSINLQNNYGKFWGWYQLVAIPIRKPPTKPALMGVLARANATTWNLLFLEVQSTWLNKRQYLVCPGASLPGDFFLHFIRNCINLAADLIPIHSDVALFVSNFQ